MSTTSTQSRSSAERVRRHRKRQRQGTRCITVCVSGLEVSALVVKGYLPEEEKGDAKAIEAAIEGVISDMTLDLPS
jgi:hypothetical protein